MPRLTRLVLVWFVLWVGAAVASPGVQLPSLQAVCSGDSVVLLPDSAGTHAGGAMLDCPLCLPLDAPQPAPGLFVAEPLPSASLARAIPATRTVKSAAAALPARGPPL